MEQSKKLEDTLLWQAYCEKISKDRKRIAWVEDVYNAAVAYLRDVRQNFKNYTLHDETHILNVLDAMGGLLGDCMEKLTEGEMELLILAASMHDLGMVYTEEEEGLWLENERAYKDFLRTCAPKWIGCRAKDWPEDIRQWYLRVQHPFRIFEVLENKAWKDLFDERPGLIVSTQCIEAVCRAHGEEPKDLRNNPDLEYQAASDVDPLFCALLLRLADLLDFDDTRAPRVLFCYAENNDKSREEWQKHQASAGFRFPAKPSTDELPYKARCKNPTIEHGVRKFLNWVDEELENCARLQKLCNGEWQRQFPFPRAILRKGIESDGYMSGDFCLTMDQERVLNLLMGENLYDNRDVFVRELLQNAIDATLLRGEMDRGFVPEEARIDFWEWMDREGNFWFRIDDYGTGMTLGMLQRYFLKVGNSYYMSQELKGDLYAHGGSKEYQGISRFGIGFLSCFLCGDYMEVSTLYFDPKKNQGEEEVSRSRTADYGLRLEVTGLKGYYTLKSQAERHPASPLPMPEAFANAGNVGMERQGYRTKAGTSVVIRLNLAKLGTLNLRKTVEKYLCAARMLVYYNNERIGRTYKDVMEIVHELAGERVYELSAELKKKFDKCFPEVKGKYPKVVSTVIPLDTEVDQILPDLSGVLIKYDVRFEQELMWKNRGHSFYVTGMVISHAGYQDLHIFSRIVQSSGGDISNVQWEDLERQYGFEITEDLKERLDTFSLCPQTEKQIGDVWFPFAKNMTIQVVWKAYLEEYYSRSMIFKVEDCACPSIRTILGNTEISNVTYAFQGVFSDKDLVSIDNLDVLFLASGEMRPMVDVSRLRIVGLTLKAVVVIYTILNKYGSINKSFEDRELIGFVTLGEWQEVLNSPIGQWMQKNHDKINDEIIEQLLAICENGKLKCNYGGSIFSLGINEVMNQYAIAYLQDNYSMIINFEEGQITLSEKKKCGENFEIFPPMMFCTAATDESRKYICYDRWYFRCGINSEHPFVTWLLENSVQLKRYFQRQFLQIVKCLRHGYAEEIIKEFSIIREQLNKMSMKYGLDLGVIPQINREDFWPPESDKNVEQECPF